VLLKYESDLQRARRAIHGASEQSFDEERRYSGQITRRRRFDS
jgi:hypothetical protein